MGWTDEPNDIFDAVAHTLLDTKTPDEITRATCATLIAALKARDWDSYDASLERFDHLPAIVSAFADCDIRAVYCDDEYSPERSYERCVAEPGHDGDHRGRYRGLTWPQTGYVACRCTCPTCGASGPACCRDDKAAVPC